MTDPILNTPPRVVPIARLAAGGRWRVEAMRSLSEPVLYWFTKGQGRMTAAGSTRGYQAHNAIFLPPGCMHGFDISPQTFGSALFFGRGCTVPLPSGPQHIRCREAAVQMELIGLIDALLRETQGEQPGHDRAADAHLRLIGVWLERQSLAHAADQPVATPARRLAARYADLLEREFRSGQTITDYARTLGVTPTHLTRVCRVTSGRSAHQILQDRRLFEARSLLGDTKMPILRVSEQLGFASAAYFTRAFRQSTGKSPSDFRRGT